MFFFMWPAKWADDGALYGAVEWSGPSVEQMTMSSRMTLANMSVEIGAKNAVIDPNPETVAFLKAAKSRDFE